jgi:hypothetical protein
VLPVLLPLGSVTVLSSLVSSAPVTAAKIMCQTLLFCYLCFLLCVLFRCICTADTPLHPPCRIPDLFVRSAPVHNPAGVSVTPTSTRFTVDYRVSSFVQVEFDVVSAAAVGDMTVPSSFDADGRICFLSDNSVTTRECCRTAFRDSTCDMPRTACLSVTLDMSHPLFVD